MVSNLQDILEDLDIESHPSTPLEFTEDEILQLSLLRSAEIDELVEASLIDSESRFDESLLNCIVLPFPEIKISLLTGQFYPAQQLQIEYENVSLPRLVMDALRIECRKMVEEGEKRNRVEAWEQREVDEMFDYDMTALKIATECDNYIKGYRDQLRSLTNLDGKGKAPMTGGILPSYGPNTVKNAIIPTSGIDPTTLHPSHQASTVLRLTPSEICALIPLSFRILHIESVLRPDLHSRFLAKQASLLAHLKTKSASSLQKCIPTSQRTRRQTVSEMAEYLVTPKMTFHGTSNQFVPSIVRHGFLPPGAKHPETHEPLPVRCGSTYGQGIYSSPSPAFSLSYSGSDAKPTKPDGFWGLKLFVCATIMGRSGQITREHDWYLKTQPMEGADSHVGNNQMEYIVFDNAQILPCYVIHLDWGVENARFFKDIDADRRNFVPNANAVRVLARLNGGEMAKGDRQREKDALVAKASKYFPYGYGPATGTRFVVEEVGEVDEDEEEYGEYQGLRVEETYEGKGGFWEWEDDEGVPGVEKEGGSRFDEYTSLRDGWGRAGTGK